jgi:hypothetical protein
MIYDFYCLGHNTIKPVESQFNVTEEYVASIFGVEEWAKWYITFVRFLLIELDDTGDIFLRNVGWISPNYTELHPRI